MAGALQRDWGFEDITAKFEHEHRPVRGHGKKKKPRTQIKARGTVRAGFWLIAVSVCLLGLVALHVSILNKNMEYNELIGEKNTLMEENAKLSSEIAELRSPGRVEEIATGVLGMIPPDKVEYVYIGPSGARQGLAELDLSDGPGSMKESTP